MGNTEKTSGSNKQDTNCWGPVVEVKGIKIPLVALALLVIGAVVGPVVAYVTPGILDPLIEIRAREIVEARPTWTPAPTYTLYPTLTSYPTCTPVPTPTPTNTPTPTSLPTPTPSVLQTEVIAIKTFHGRYVTAMDAGWNWELRAETEVLGDWEKFVLLHLDNGKVALKTFHGRFVSATDNTGCCDWVLRAETRERGMAEEFTLVDLGNGKVAFETYYGRYVTAFDAGRCWMLRAETQKLSTWEEFTVVPWGSTTGNTED